MDIFLHSTTVAYISICCTYKQPASISNLSNSPNIISSHVKHYNDTDIVHDRVTKFPRIRANMKILLNLAAFFNAAFLLILHLLFVKMFGTNFAKFASFFQSVCILNYCIFQLLHLLPRLYLFSLKIGRTQLYTSMKATIFFCNLYFWDWFTIQFR